MKHPNAIEILAIQYVINTGGTASVAVFDDDHEPIGPMLRQAIMPQYVKEEFGKLYATNEGRFAVTTVRKQ